MTRFNIVMEIELESDSEHQVAEDFKKLVFGERIKYIAVKKITK